MIKINQKMLRFLCDLYESKESLLSSRLKEIIDGGVIEEDGCWFLARCRVGGLPHISIVQNQTGMECFVNHIHTEDYIGTDFAILQEQGLIFVCALRRILEPLGAFNIIMSVSWTDFDDAPNHLSCTVRFHKIRAGETWLTEDLEGYLDGILQIGTGESSVSE
jgi:hypothetical protein